MRYFLHYSSIFDDPMVIGYDIYDIDLFKKVIKENGGKYIRTSNNYGLSNQPKVVTFNADNKKVLKNIKNELNKLRVFEIWGCLIYEKDW